MENSRGKEDCDGNADGQASIVLLNHSEKVKNEKLLSTTDIVDCNVETLKVSENRATPLTKLQIWKNIVIMCFAFFFLVTSYTSLLNLQSSLNKDEGIGTITLAIVYTTLVVSYAVLVNPIISKFGCKWSMVTASAVYIYQMAANMYPKWPLMISSGFLVGVAIAPLWTGFTLYCTQISMWLAKLTKRKEKDVMVFHFGLFYTVFNTSKIMGNVLSSAVLEYKETNKTQPSPTEINRCIANENIAILNITTLERPDDIKIYILCGVWIGLSVLGVGCFLLVDNISLEIVQKNKTITESLMATLKHLWNSRTQKIILPLSIYSGMLQGFITADFIRSFVACALGVESTGYVMVCNGLGLALSAAIIGLCAKCVAHIHVFTIAFLLAVGVQSTLLVWRPTVDSASILCAIAAVLGVVVCVLKTQLTAFYGLIFRDNVEAGYGNYYSFEGIGLAVSFAYSSYVGTQHKLYILQGLLFVSIVSYYTIEYIERHKHNEAKEAVNTKLQDGHEQGKENIRLPT